MAVRERHLEGVERKVDVGAVLVAAWSQVALDQLGCVLRQRPTVVPGARPVAIGDLGDDVAPLLECFEDYPDVELHAQRALDPDFNVVEVDENRNLQSCVCQNPSRLPFFCGREAVNQSSIMARIGVGWVFGPAKAGHYGRAGTRTTRSVRLQPDLYLALTS